MDQTIWKFTVDVDDVQTIEMPRGAVLLTVQTQVNHVSIWATVQTQVNHVSIWAMVDPRAPVVNRVIQMAGTGHDLSNRIMGPYVGTFQVANGALVFHVFDGGEE